MNKSSLISCVVVLAGFFSCATPNPEPKLEPSSALQTTAEASEWQATTSHAESERLLTAILALDEGKVLTRMTQGASEEGRALSCIRVAKAGAVDEQMLRIFVNGNIHGGEVEGKEASLQILREFAQGEHQPLLENCVIYFLPIFNADGNDKIDPRHRVSQNGPALGVGQRPNANRLDLNRDFVKVESEEVRTLLRHFRQLDPHLFMDLHTTNGSAHGYDLTYAASLATNVDVSLRDYMRDSWFPEIRQQLRQESGYETFDYGNFAPTKPQPKVWATYDHRARFGTNYYGLRNRLSVLVEAYSYLDFHRRIAVTKAFVLANLEMAAREAQKIISMCERADAQSAQGNLRQGGWLYDTKRKLMGRAPVLTRSLEKQEIPGLGTRYIAGPLGEAIEVDLLTAFESSQQRAFPKAWVLQSADPAIVQRLHWHGIEFGRLSEPSKHEVEVFHCLAKKSTRAFQGHHEVKLDGDWIAKEVELPAGTIVVPSQQRLVRVAAQLLSPLSEDGLHTWNFMDAALFGPETGPRAFPVWRLIR